METGFENLSKSELIPLLLEANEKTENLQLAKQKLEAEVEHFKLKSQLLVRLLYGQKRERFETSDLPQLPFTEQPGQAEQREEETVEKITYERKKPRPNHPGRKP